MRKTSITALVWYVSGVSALLALLASAMTVLPGAEQSTAMIIGGLASFAVVTALAAIALGRLPLTHRLHQSQPLFIVTLIMATAVTMLLFLVAG